MKKIALIKSKNDIWKAFNNILLKKNYSPTLIDPFINKELEFLLNNKWDAVIWVAKQNLKIKKLAKKILGSLDKEKNIKIYPDWNSYWHYDDKISQYFLLKRSSIPIPKTNIFYDSAEAINHINSVELPVIFKYEDGASSENVFVVKSKHKGKRKIYSTFNKGFRSILTKKKRKKHLIIQEFQKNNSGDYRLVCYGKEILGYFRENRDNEPLASGSNKIDFKEIPSELLTWTYDINKKLGYKVMSYDIIKGNDSDWVITEISVVYGDLKMKFYNDARIYSLQDDSSWKEIQTDQPHYERVAEYIINSWFSNE